MTNAYCVSAMSHVYIVAQAASRLKHLASECVSSLMFLQLMHIGRIIVGRIIVGRIIVVDFCRKSREYAVDETNDR